MSDIGNAIRMARKYKGLTQEELAKRAGISMMSIRRYESGDRMPTENIVNSIFTILKPDNLGYCPCCGRKIEISE